MRNESDLCYFAQRGTSHHQTTAEREVALLHAKEGAHQEAPVEKIAGLIGLGGKPMIVKMLVNADASQEVEEINGNDLKQLTKRSCGAYARD
jgi:hypothetical protein